MEESGRGAGLESLADAEEQRIDIGFGPEFRQIDGSVTRQHSGTGLGLAISKELSTLLGGSIGLQSQAGAGATFYVILPVKIDASNADVRSKMVLN